MSDKQRAYRKRHNEYVKQLEDRVKELEAENLVLRVDNSDLESRVYYYESNFPQIQSPKKR